MILEPICRSLSSARPWVFICLRRWRAMGRGARMDEMHSALRCVHSCVKVRSIQSYICILQAPSTTPPLLFYSVILTSWWWRCERVSTFPCCTGTCMLEAGSYVLSRRASRFVLGFPCGKQSSHRGRHIRHIYGPACNALFIYVSACLSECVRACLFCL